MGKCLVVSFIAELFMLCESKQIPLNYIYFQTNMEWNGMEWNGKTLFKQGGPFSTKAGIHRGPVSRYKLYIEITRYNI